MLAADGVVDEGGIAEDGVEARERMQARRVGARRRGLVDERRHSVAHPQTPLFSGRFAGCVCGAREAGKSEVVEHKGGPSGRLWTGRRMNSRLEGLRPPSPPTRSGITAVERHN